MGIRRDIVGYVTLLSFGLVPVAGMILASREVLRPTGLSVFRISALLAVLLLILYALLRRFLSSEAASNSLGLPLLLVALYPGANTLAKAIPRVDLLQFAWLYLALCIFFAWATIRLRAGQARTLREVLMIIAVLFLAFSSFAIGSVYGVTVRYSAATERAIERLSAPLATPLSVQKRPDVFHFVLDGMGRPDVLAAKYGANLDESIEQLRRLGFQIDREIGQANYVQTHLSIPSMLNVSYLEELAVLQGPTNDRGPLRALIRRASVPRLFKALGYRVSMIGALYATPFDVSDDCGCAEPWFFEPEMGTMSLTPLKVLLNLGLGHKSHYRRSLGIFDEFERDGDDSAPRYVYGHVMLPHPPFVISASGDYVNPRRPFSVADASFYKGTATEYRAGYREQAMFAMRRTSMMASRILENARRHGREVVIIIHGDHGPRLEFDARNPSPTSSESVLPILLAIHWPAGFQPASSPSSLVNVYRVLLSTLFGMDLPALPDKAFLSGFTTPYMLVPVDVPQRPVGLARVGNRDASR